MRIGFIGLGNMGQPMARNLLKAGHTVTVYNRTRRRAEELISEGAIVASSASEAAKAGIVLTMLSDDRAVEEIVFGSGNLMGSMISGAAHVSMSTISVALSERLASAHEKAGHAYLSAPVFGRPDTAAAGRLFIVAAGQSEWLERCRPLFEAMGQKVFTIGVKPPAANVVKLTGNFLIACVIECLAEAFALVRKSGVDPHTFLDVMTESLFSAPVYRTYGALIADNRFEPAGFRLSLGLKDIRLTLAAAEGGSVPMPVASLIRDHLISAVAHGMQDADWSSFARIVAENAGLTLPG